MINPPAGWVVERRQSGLIMFPPDRDGGVICHQDHHQPLRPVTAILSGLSTPLGWVPSRAPQIERLVTVEGEHAALCTMTGTLDGEPSERVVGIVFTETFFTLTTSLVTRPDQFERFRSAVRQIVINDTFMLGIRRRRFVYARPAGWHGFSADSMHATWLPIDYPRTTAMLTVFPAQPVSVGTRDHAERFARLQAARLESDQVTCFGLLASTEISGQHWQIVAAGDGEVILHDIAVLEDRRYIYPVVLETFADQREHNLATLMQVVRSIEPIPGAERSTDHAGADLFLHWSE
jgi:hypothetical protein